MGKLKSLKIELVQISTFTSDDYNDQSPTKSLFPRKQNIDGREPGVSRVVNQ